MNKRINTETLLTLTDTWAVADIREVLADYLGVEEREISKEFVIIATEVLAKFILEQKITRKSQLLENLPSFYDELFFKCDTCQRDKPNTEKDQCNFCALIVCSNCYQSQHQSPAHCNNFRKTLS